MAIDIQGGVYYAAFQVRGRRYHPCLHTKNKAEAYRLEEKAKTEARDLARGTIGTSISWATFKKEYFRRRELDKSPNCLRVERYAIIKLDNFAPLHDIEDFTPELIEDFRISQKDKGKGLGGANRDARALKVVLRWAIKTNLAKPKNLDLIGRFKLPPVTADHFTIDEFNGLLSVASKFSHHLTLAMLAGRAGMRLSECYWLRWSACDMVLRRINIVAIPGLFTPKANRIRFIPMAQDLYEYLKQTKPLAKSEYVIEGHGTGWRPASAYSMAGEFKKQVVKAAGLRKSVHILRHSFATHFLQGGNDLKDLRDILGHSSITTTEHYAHEATSRLDATILKMPKIKAPGVTRRP